MFRTKVILMLAIATAMAASYCPAAPIAHNWYWSGKGSTSGGSTLWTMDLWWDNPGFTGTHPDYSMLTAADPNSAFWSNDRGIGCKTVVLTDPMSRTFTAPITIVTPVAVTNQTMDANSAPYCIEKHVNALQFGDSDAGPTGVVYQFNDLKLQGLLKGQRVDKSRLAGKVTLTGPTSIASQTVGGNREFYIDAEIDASILTELRTEFFSRATNWPNICGLNLNSSAMWFCGNWILDTRMYVTKAGCMGDCDIQINGPGTPGLVDNGDPTKTPPTHLYVAWYDRRSGALVVDAIDAVSRNAKVVVVDSNYVVASPLEYNGQSPPAAFTVATPQCPGARIYVKNTASPLTVRELWVDGVQKAPGTYYATDAANQPWYGTYHAAGLTSANYGASSIVVTGGTTRDVTMAAVLETGSGPVADASLTTYPRVGLTKAFLEGYALKIKANSPIVSSSTGYKFANWTTSTGSGIADTSAAQTTLTVPTGVDVTVTAHYVLAAFNPTPYDGATEVAINTGLDWTPASPTATQDLYFGTSTDSLAFVKHFANGATHGASNAEIGGLLDDTTTYYWRVDTDGQAGFIWTFKTIKRRPEDPNPADGATNVERITPNLSWGMGHATATSWDVYFGSSKAAVENAVDSSDPTFLVTRLVSDANEPNAPAGLLINTTYYWRVDETNAYGWNKGFVWSFTTRGPLCMRTVMGDLNADCKVTFVDFAIISSHFLNN